MEYRVPTRIDEEDPDCAWGNNEIGAELGFTYNDLFDNDGDGRVDCEDFGWDGGDCDEHCPDDQFNSCEGPCVDAALEPGPPGSSAFLNTCNFHLTRRFKTIVQFT